MKDMPRIAEALFSQPWAIMPSVHQSMVEQFQNYCKNGSSGYAKIEPVSYAVKEKQPDTRAAADDPVGPCWRGEDGKMRSHHEQVEVVGNLAIVKVRGAIGKHLSQLAMMCGGVDAALIARQAKNIANDPTIENVIVYIDSPGGTCIGGWETAQAILSMSQSGKSTVAYVDKVMASAGYFLGAACDLIWAAPSAIVGSISTFSAALDSSRQFEMEGLERLVFRSGEVKGSGTPGKPWTEAEKEAAQLVVDQYSDQFKGFVRTRRGLADDVMQGQYWPAEFAPGNVVDELVDDFDTAARTVLGG